MVDLSNYPYPGYEPNKIAAGALAAVIGISLIAWTVQCIQSHMKLRRIAILIFVSHLTFLIELVLRAALPADTRRSRVAFAATTALLAISQRTIIVANVGYLVQASVSKLRWSRAIIIGTTLSVVTSAILMITAGALSQNKYIDTSFHLRQASAAIVLLLTILIYPVWFVLKGAQDMSKQAALLLVVSSFACLAISLFLMVTAIPSYYVSTNQQESWFYIFYVTPLTIALVTWTILHPRRSLVLTPQQQKDIELNHTDSL